MQTKVRQAFARASHDLHAYYPSVRSVTGIFVRFTVLACCYCSAAVAAVGLTTTAPSKVVAADLSTIDDQISRLGDPDPSVRRRAADALIHLGASARSAVLSASHSDDPQMSDAAQQVLRSLPWSSPDDPPAAKKLLDNYGPASAAERIGIVEQIADISGTQPALFRLLSDELNEDICWQVEAQLVERQDRATVAASRRIDLQGARPAALVLAARSWLTPLANEGSPLPIDRAKALMMLRKAVELESTSATFDDGQLDFAFDQLASDAVEHRQYEEAAQLRRQQCKRIGITRSSFPTPFFELLILHADFGPLPGFEGDLQGRPDEVATPESLYILSRLYARLGQNLAAAALEQAALAASPSEEMRSAATSFALDHGWNVFATKECRATLSRADAKPDREDVNARLRLSSLAAIRGDEAQAADQLRMALQDHKISGGELTMTRGSRNIGGAEAEQAMEIEVAQHALHAAQARVMPLKWGVRWKSSCD